MDGIPGVGSPALAGNEVVNFLAFTRGVVGVEMDMVQLHARSKDVQPLQEVEAATGGDRGHHDTAGSQLLGSVLAAISQRAESAQGIHRRVRVGSLTLVAEVGLLAFPAMTLHVLDEEVVAEEAAVVASGFGTRVAS